jgi:hypothetical protein
VRRQDTGHMHQIEFLYARIPQRQLERTELVFVYAYPLDEKYLFWNHCLILLNRELNIQGMKKRAFIVLWLMLFAGCVAKAPEVTTSSTSTLISTTTTTTTTIPEAEDSVLEASVGCVPISLRFKDNMLSIQANSLVVPAAKTKSVDEYKVTTDIRENIVVNRDDLFVYYAKSCCATETGYSTYHYFIVASVGSKERYMPEPEGGLLFDYSSIEGRYETYSLRETTSRDFTGSVKTWSECGRSYILSMGWETRRDGKTFTTPAMIERLT